MSFILQSMRCFLCQFFTRRKSPVKSSASDDKLVEENFRPNEGTSETAANVLVFSLKTLSNISGSISKVGALSGITDALLSVVGQVQVRPVATILDSITIRVQQTPANEQSLVQLAARIERLTTIVTESDPEQRKDIVEKLQKELASMTEELNAAKDKGKLSQFFNSTDNSTILQNHNIALDQMIADSSFLTVHEIPKSIRDLENSKIRPEITGGTGSTGDNGHVGGEGGEGEGPRIDMDPGERPQIGSVSGGTGGTGGAGVQVGGKGGTGKGPVINLRRMRAFMSPKRQSQVDPIL
ncbi:hypothetical protein MSAN_02437100 [Mycena sanguinolenta]|uniref:Uncharacterized protein n=1 Tax=Mycena sanguinolenta TaxID=230812 RepID=A0A8H6WYT1_9AGAR|nr:hypothetical protein MSAN_02437100 [Mycena sanguinolenta]